MFVGYAPDSPAWLVYNPRTRNVIRTASATFDESWRDSTRLAWRAEDSLTLGEDTVGVTDTVTTGETSDSSNPRISASGEDTTDESTPVSSAGETAADSAPRVTRASAREAEIVSFHDAIADIADTADSPTRNEAVQDLLSRISQNHNADEFSELIAEAQRQGASLDPGEPTAALIARVIPEPRSYYSATSSSNPHCKEWKAAADKEFNAQLTKGTWYLVRLPSGCRAIGCMWVFKVKRDGNGEIIKFKARICARGDHQIYEVDYSETILSISTLRVDQKGECKISSCSL